MTTTIDAPTLVEEEIRQPNPYNDSRVQAYLVCLEAAQSLAEELLADEFLEDQAIDSHLTEDLTGQLYALRFATSMISGNSSVSLRCGAAAVEDAIARVHDVKREREEWIERVLGRCVKGFEMA